MKLVENTIDHWIRLSEEIAKKIHVNDKRNGGEPYITHCARVASRVPDRLKPIAWLHDTVEDHPDEISISLLRKEGFPQYILSAVDLLTHKAGDSNIVYWTRILSNPDAIAVKLVDIDDNLHSNPSEHAKQKYARALALFKKHGYSL